MKFRMLNDQTGRDAFVKTMIATKSLRRSFHHIEQVSSFLSAKDADRAIRLSQKIIVFVEEIEEALRVAVVKQIK